ncbi:UDP-N-acetylmuramoyl-L-alanyl-D-glutamate--2,6-diaminopimelate ligase [Legionella israelensis]|uniref:UDP-N-acetylmuramoyl-L-alanyl-D-glutamate--2, 6-diaminopimelate ligase n=1 Tax=Legionella israelensis TaxID=454 RepID=UPI0011802F6B|nr:UDP-N-acetylmuramoyl-L-alanyl-D-glutamate--2,6-diaminopimelate ligase [Legionella israelensis]QDP72978.1 UDP-N-acetylmuramoyl-L-alanyl-D-glutamate--2,6-diaminopimelate ligase [Legionella israelensis]
MKLEYLLKPWIKDVLPECEITGLQNDSRQVQKGDLFIAYPGAVTDGRDYIKMACTAGAAAVIYDPTGGFTPSNLSLSIPLIALEHLTIKLSSIAGRFYDHPGKKLLLTGVTGTNGKTTIAYQLAQAHALLEQKAAYIGTLGEGQVGALQSLNNTTPDALCLQKLLFNYQENQVKHVCMEVSSHALSQYRVADIPFTQAIFTNLSHDHLDYHHTMEDYAAAKARLFSIPGLQWAILNKDDKYAVKMLTSLAKTAEILTYGMSQDSNIKLSHWNMDMTGTQLEVSSPWGAHHFRINALGKFNMYNALAIFSSLLVSNYSVNQVVEVMSLLKPAPGRMEVVATDPLIIVDYAHTPDALENVLITLKQLKRGKLWVVFGCGGDRDKTKRPVMGRVASQHADKIIITSDNPRGENPLAIVEEIAEGITTKIDTYKEVDRNRAIQEAIYRADKDDIILIAGKGHEAYQQIGQVKYPFSDQQTVREFLKCY